VTNSNLYQKVCPTLKKIIETIDFTNELAFWNDKREIGELVRPDTNVFAGSVVEPDDGVWSLRVFGRQGDHDVLVQILQKADPF